MSSAQNKELVLITELPPEAERLLIQRVTPKTQEIDLQNGGKLTAEQIEEIGDKAVMQIQEIAGQRGSEIEESENKTAKAILKLVERVEMIEPEGLENLAELIPAMAEQIASKAPDTTELQDEPEAEELPEIVQTPIIALLQTIRNNLKCLFTRIVTLNKYTFIVNSDAALEAWAVDAPGNDYSRILIKAGTWTYNAPNSNGGTAADPLSAIDISDGRTLSVVGESGSRLVINNESSATTYYCGIKGKADGSYPNFINPGTDYFFRNVTVEVNQNNTAGTGYGRGFYNCTNLTNCTGTGTGYGYGYGGCVKLFACKGLGTGSQAGFGFDNCRVGLGCTSNGASTIATFNSCFMEQNAGTTLWANTAAGGWNLA